MRTCLIPILGLCVLMLAGWTQFAPGAEPTKPNAAPSTGSDAGPFVRSLWLVQQYGTAAATDPGNDQRAKGALAKALGKDGGLALSKLEGFIEFDTAKRLAGADGRISTAKIKQAVDAAVPESRTRLLPKLREHADFLTTSFDMIDEPHRLAGGKLADWIAKNYLPGQRLGVWWSARAIPAGVSLGRRWVTLPPPITGCRRFASTAAARLRRRAIPAR